MTKAAVLLSLLVLLLATVSYAQDVYKIGAIFSVTGTSSSLGIPEKNTAEMLEKEINAAGGINGKKLQIIVYDDAGDETNARNRFNKLVNEDKVCAVVGPTLSGTSLALVDLANSAQVPLISCAASVKIVEPVSERKWVFKTPQSDVLVAEKIAEYLRSKKITKVAILTLKNPFGASGKEQLERILPNSGITIVAKEEFNDKDPDTLVQLTKIKGTEAQAVICWATTQGAAMVTRNMKVDLKMDIPLIMSHGVANKEYIDLSGDAANGVVFPAGKLLVAEELPARDQQRVTLLKYAKSYRENFKSEPSTFGGHAWDAIMLVVNAMKKAGDDKAKIRDEIEKTKNFTGISGIFNFSPSDHNGLTKDCLVMVKITNKKWTLAK